MLLIRCKPVVAYILSEFVLEYHDDTYFYNTSSQMKQYMVRAELDYDRKEQSGMDNPETLTTLGTRQSRDTDNTGYKTIQRY